MKEVFFYSHVKEELFILLVKMVILSINIISYT